MKRAGDFIELSTKRNLFSAVQVHLGFLFHICPVISDCQTQKYEEVRRTENQLMYTYLLLILKKVEWRF